MILIKNFCVVLFALFLLFSSGFLDSPWADARRHGAANTKDRTTERTRMRTAWPRPPQPKKPEEFNGWSGGLQPYVPGRDRVPVEECEIEETDFFFAGMLFVRPTTEVIVIHHVGVPDGDTSAERIHSAHIYNDWAGIGYHYVIRQDGTIQRGRPLITVGAHSYMHNIYSVGICLSGNFEVEMPTDAQIESLIELLSSLCRIYSIAPSDHTIVGHLDMNRDTGCPGYNLYMELPYVIDEVKNRRNN